MQTLRWIGIAIVAGLVGAVIGGLTGGMIAVMLVSAVAVISGYRV